MKQMTVSALTDKDLVGARDNEVGDIERVVESNADKKQYLVISRGGFLGLFETEVLVPLENVAAQGDRIVLRNLTEEQVCAICLDARRDHSVICVVEHPVDLISLERTHEFRGLYHVLGGSLSPIACAGACA